MAAGGQNPMGTSGGTMSTPTGSPGMASPGGGTKPPAPGSPGMASVGGGTKPAAPGAGSMMIPQNFAKTASALPQGQPLSGNPSGNPNGMPGAPGGTMSSQSRPPGGAPPPPTGTNTSVGPSFGTPRTGMM